MMNNFKSYFLCLIVIGFLSCEKEPSQTNQIVETKELTLELLKSEAFYEFPDDTSFWSAIDQMEAMDAEDLANFTTKQSGFKSYAVIYDEFVDKINDENLTEKTAAEVLREYNDILIFEEDRIRPRIENPLVQHLINRHGLLKIGNELALYTETEKIVSTKGDLESIFQALSTGEEVDDVYRFKYRQDKNNEPYCGSFQEAIFTRADHERRATLECFIIWDDTEKYLPNCPTGQGRHFKTYAYSVGLPEKKNFFTSKWVNYKTINTLDLNYRAKAWAGEAKTVIDFRQNTEKAHSITHRYLLHEGDGCLSEQGNFQGYFIYMNETKYQTWGIDQEGWATINCNTFSTPHPYE